VAFYRDRGLDERVVKQETLSIADKEALQRVMARHVDVGRVRGFWPTVFVSGVVFGILGFATGVFAKSWAYVGILRLASFVFNNPLIRSAIIKDWRRISNS